MGSRKNIVKDMGNLNVLAAILATMQRVTSAGKQTVNAEMEHQFRLHIVQLRKRKSTDCVGRSSETAKAHRG
eukprot:TRINITY_DN10557_c0_g1_i1.p3 TRINITY_DN10557_c0_g1~~TRINITY_DN10557_c0_g1_i1.p3  ORF type:complete len:72 (+),score=29.81 TRINITY_DN10557_c0_g1_i1:348-563(+)